MSRWFTVASFVAASLLQIHVAAAQDKLDITAPSVSFGSLPIYVAQTQGYFKQNGLEVTTTLARSGPLAIAATINGDVPAVGGQSTTMLAARQAGGDIVMFACTGSVFGSNLVVSKKWADDHKLSAKSTYKEKLAALKGATIAITAQGGANDQLVRYLAVQGGLDADRDLTMITIPETSAMLTAFSAARVDGLSVSSPTSNSAARDFGGHTLFNLATGDIPEMDGIFCSVVSARGDWLQKNTVIKEKFLKGLQMGLDALHDPARVEKVGEDVRKAFFPQMDAGFYHEVFHDWAKSAPKTPAITRAMIEKVVEFSNRFAKDKIDAKTIDGSFAN